MKTIALFATACLLSMNLISGNIIPDDHPDKYCAKLKDGKLTVMHHGNVLTADAILSNGSAVKMDGTVIKKDGTKIILKEDECIDKDGNISKEKETKKKTTKGNY